MGKRKQSKDIEAPDNNEGEGVDEEMEDSSDDEDADTLNVDFELFDPQPEHDFHGLKILLRQLLGNDAQLFNLSALVELVLSQPTIGSTVKVESNETDPFAFLTVLNMQEHRNHSVIKDLNSYVTKQGSSNAQLSKIPSFINGNASSQVGLILAERLVNIPTEIVPPMYTMLIEEVEWAVKDKEPYEFSHYLILSRTYIEIDSVLDQEDHRPQKKSKKGKASKEVFYFHPEDEVFHQYAIAHGSFEYTNKDAEGASDSRRAFQDSGIQPQGHMILLEASKFKEAIEAVRRFASP